MSFNTQAVVSQLMLDGAGAPTGRPSSLLLLPTPFLVQPSSRACREEGEPAWPLGREGFLGDQLPFSEQSCMIQLSESKQLCQKLKSFSFSLHVLLSFFPVAALPTSPHVPMLALTEPLHGAVQFIGLAENEPPPKKTGCHAKAAFSPLSCWLCESCLLPSIPSGTLQPCC